MDKISVIGLGYIGLPTASILATNGFKVVGVDTDDRIVSTIGKANSHIEEPGLNTIVNAAVKSGNLVAKKRPEEAKVFIITVPTPLTDEKKADLSHLKSAMKNLVPVLKKGDLVIIESTSPPGTTRDEISPIIEKSGLNVGSDIHLAYCPERVLPGNILEEIVENDRIIGGVNPESTKKAKEVYQTFVEGDLYCADATTAEFVKLIENTYRDVNIALANQLADFAEQINIDVWEAIEFANKHPRLNIHQPGPGVGGHCLPIDPWFLLEQASVTGSLISKSREINDQRPNYVFREIQGLVKDIPEPKVTLLGLSYKGNVEDTRESPSLKIADLLVKENINFTAFDPYVDNFDFQTNELGGAVDGSDCIVILTDHKEFENIDLKKLRESMEHKYVFDTKNILNRKRWEKAGFNVKILGVNKTE